MKLSELIKQVKKVYPGMYKEVEKTQYKMPSDYINWKYLSEIIIVSLLFKKGYITSSDGIASQYYKILSACYENNMPLYCVSRQLIDLLEKTDVKKEGVFLNWEPPIPGFILAIPSNLIYSSSISEGVTTHVAVVIENHVLVYHVAWATLEKGGLETCYNSSAIIEINGTPSYDSNSMLDSEEITKLDKIYLNRIDNLVLNILLLLSTPSELSDDFLIPQQEFKSGTGFSVSRDKKNENILYPRWLDLKKDSQSSTKKTTTHLTHNSPVTHWRRGHWRTLQLGEGKKWKETKRLWIRPQLINSENTNQNT